MEEIIGKRFTLYFRLALIGWILIANAILHVIGFKYGWLIFISNIMFFTLEGDNKDKFISVEIGGLTGLILAVLMLLTVSTLTPIFGELFGFLVTLGVVLVLLILGHSLAPKVLNNVGFIYFTCAFIDATEFATHISTYIGTFIVGTLIFNGVSILLMKVAKNLAVKSVTKVGASS